MIDILSYLMSKKYTDKKIASLGRVFNYKGKVTTAQDLPTTGNRVGDVYYVVEADAEYVWIVKDGTETWEELGAVIDLSGYYTKTEADNKFVDVTGDTMTGDLNVSDGNVNRVKLAKDGSMHIYDSTGVSESIINNNVNGTTFITNSVDGSLTLTGPKANLTLSGGEAKVSRNGGTASGQGSTAVGGGSTASGSYSIAISPGAQASGNQSVALGSGAQASGTNSVAIGGGAMAKGSTSIAIGGGADVTGSTSASFGANTVSASNSLIVGGGNSSTANAYGSIVGGVSNSAKNTKTLTIGTANTNAGVDSVALGYNNFVGGNSAQVEGEFSVASGDQSHAEGLGSVPTNLGSATVLTSTTRTVSGFTYTDITFAQGNLDLKNGDIFNGIPCTRVSLSSGTYTAGFSGDLTNVLKVDDTVNISRSLHVASGQASHVEGSDTSAFDKFSHAEGFNTKTLGSNGGSHAEGMNTTANSSNGPAPHAEGYGTTASNFCSHAEGSNTTASGAMSHAEGGSTTASGSSSHAEGYGTTASDSYSHAEGNNTVASGSSSHAEGQSTIASSSSSHAEGQSTIARGAMSHAEGISTVAIGTYSHAEGQSTIASGYCSHTEGYGEAIQSAIGNITVTEVNTTNNTIKGTISVGTIQPGYYIKVVTSSTTSYRTVLGVSNTAYTLNSVANISVNDVLDFGITNGRASGYASHSEGYCTIADGDYSHAEGHSTTTGADYQHVQGKYNIQDNTSAHIVGNGSADDARSNAHTLDFSGNAWFSGDVYVGSTSGTNKDAGSKKLATEDYVDTAIATAITNAISASY